MQGSEDKPLPLAVYNTKNHTLRELVVVPSRRWAGEGLLGLTIRFDTFKGADEHMLHVLEITRDSPADIAGLQPLEDYLLGTAEKVGVEGGFRWNFQQLFSLLLALGFQ